MFHLTNAARATGRSRKRCRIGCDPKHVRLQPVVELQGRTEHGGARQQLSAFNNRLNDFTLHVGQTEVAASVAVGHALMIVAHQVQDRGVQVVR